MTKVFTIRYTDDDDFQRKIEDSVRLVQDIYYNVIITNEMRQRQRENAFSGNSYLLENLDYLIQEMEKIALSKAERFGREYTSDSGSEATLSVSR